MNVEEPWKGNADTLVVIPVLFINLLCVLNLVPMFLKYIIIFGLNKL